MYPTVTTLFANTVRTARIACVALPNKRLPS